MLLIAPDGAGHYVTALHPIPAELRRPPEMEDAIETFRRMLGDPHRLASAVERAWEKRHARPRGTP